MYVHLPITWAVVVNGSGNSDWAIFEQTPSLIWVGIGKFKLCTYAIVLMEMPIESVGPWSTQKSGSASVRARRFFFLLFGLVFTLGFGISFTKTKLGTSSKNLCSCYLLYRETGGPVSPALLWIGQKELQSGPLSDIIGETGRPVPPNTNVCYFFGANCRNRPLLLPTRQHATSSARKCWNDGFTYTTVTI